MAIDAGHAALTQQGVSFLAIFAFRVNGACVMTTAAGDAVLSMHIGLDFRRECGPARLPNLGIAEIIGGFGVNIAQARRDMGIGLDEPVGRGDVAVAAGRPYAFVVAAMRRVLEIRIIGLKRLAVA